MWWSWESKKARTEIPGHSRPCPWSSYSDIFIIFSRSKQVTGPTRIKGWRKTQRFSVKTQEHAVPLAWTETRAVPMSPRIGLCSAGTKFCGFMLVRMSLMPPLCKLLCRSLSRRQLFLATPKIEALQHSHRPGEVPRSSPLGRRIT